MPGPEEAKKPEEKGSLLSLFENRLGGYVDQYQEPLPEVTPGCDFKEQTAYFYRKNEGAYIVENARTAFNNVVKMFSPEQREELYNRVMKEEKRAGFPLEDFQTQMKERGRTRENWLLDPAVSGSGWRETVSAMEEVMTPEQRRAAVDSLSELYPPTSEKFPEERKYQHLQGEKIAQLKDSLPDGPRKEEDRKLLDSVNDILIKRTEEMTEFMDKVDFKLTGSSPASGKIPHRADAKFSGLQNMADYAGYDGLAQYMARPENVQAANNKIPVIKDRSSYDTLYDLDSYASGDGEEFTDEDLQRFRKEHEERKPNISEKTLSTVAAMQKEFDEMGSSKLFRDDEGIPISEKGGKSYAYTQLCTYASDMNSALEQGDLDTVREAHGKYRQERAHLDRLFELGKVQEGQMSLFAGNLNSTRAFAGNYVPLDHMQDFVAHSRVNGMFLLHNLCDYSGVTLTEAAQDPGKCMLNAAKKFNANFGLNRGGTTAERLLNALDKNSPGNTLTRWTSVAGCAMRGMDTLSGMAYSEQERQDLIGGRTFATAVASHEFRKEHELHKTMQKTEDARRLMVQSAILQSDEELDLHDTALRYTRGELTPDSQLSAMREKGVDFGGIADRASQVLTDLNALYEKKSVQVKGELPAASMDLVETNRFVLTTCTKVMEMASPEQRQSEGFQKLSALAGKLDIQVKDMADQDALEEKKEYGKKATAEADALSEQLAVLTAPKKGLFLSSTNTPEHQDMVRKQADVVNKMKLAEGKDVPGLSPEDRERLNGIPLRDLVKDARASTYTYMRLKTKNGLKEGFGTDVGANRYNAANASLTALDTLSDKLNLRSPVEKMMDDARKKMLNAGPGDAEKVKECAAKVVLGQMLLRNPEMSSPERQAEALDPKNLEKGLDSVRKQPAFARMIKDEGAKNVTAKLTEDPAKLYASFSRAAGKVKTAGNQAKTKTEPTKTAPKKVKKTAPKAAGMN